MDFSSMSGWDFERYCADCLLKKGFTKAEVTSGSGDHGVDIIAEQNGIRFGIQCKLYQGQIPNKAVQEAYTGASYYDCDVAVIMSNSELTKQAKDEAQKLRVKFWDIADYVPKDDKKLENPSHKVSNAEKIKTSQLFQQSDEPRNYQEYLQNQKLLEDECEEEVRKKLRSSSKKTRKSCSHGVAMMMKPVYRYHRFTKATAWLSVSMKNGCRKIVRSIQCYCDELENINKTVLKSDLLLGKLQYMSTLQKVMYGALIGSQFQFNCERMNDALKFAESQRVTDYGFNGFELQCWENSYWAEQYQIALSLIGRVFDSLERDELFQISGMASDFWYEPDTPEARAFDTLKNSVKGTFEEWKRYIGREEYFYTIWRPWEGNAEVKKKIEEHKSKMASVFDSVIEFKSMVEQERRRELEQKCKEQQEKERILKEKERRERESLFEKQQEEERLLKQQQEKELLIQSIVTVYNDGCKKINAEMSNRKKELENKAQVAISQAQQQIADLLKKKQSFTFFRKERDAKIDATIATIERYVEQVKANLASDTEECEQEAQRKIKGLKEYALHRAEQIGATEDLEKMIR